MLDTNSLISALLIRTSVSRRAFDKALDHYQILVSVQTLAEFGDVASRQKFERYFNAEEREGFLELLHREAILVNVITTVGASRDPDDNKFLELALDGAADVIISGDADLLVLDPFEGVRIVSPQMFLHEFPP